MQKIFKHMPKKKIVKFNKKNLTICPDCGKPKIKDERIVTLDRMGLVDENLEPHKADWIPLS